MLSRVANNLYWLGRYVERAENLARLVGVSQFASLDDTLPAPEQAANHLLFATGLEEAFQTAVADGYPDKAVNAFITYAPSNPHSIVQCINFARENARTVRDQLSEPAWVELNGIHLFLKNADIEQLWADDPQDLLDRVIRFSLLFQGLITSTNLHDEGWDFIVLGRYLERADKISRFLDTLTFLEDPSRSAIASVLNSCSGLTAYSSQYRGNISLEGVTMFLLCSSQFPRSVRFSLQQVNELLHTISGTPKDQFSNEAERLTGKLLAEITFVTNAEVKSYGLHQYIDDLQLKLNEIGSCIIDTYVSTTSEMEEIDLLRQPTLSHQQHWRVSFLQQQQQQQ